MFFFFFQTSQAAEIIQRELNTALQQNGVVLPPQLLQYNNAVTTQVDGPTDLPIQSDSSIAPIPGPSWRDSSPEFSSRSPGFQVNVKATTFTMDKILNEGLTSLVSFSGNIVRA